MSPRDNSKRKKYNEEEATSIAFWIEEVIDEDLEFPEDIMGSLRSGVDLCRLVNELQPGIVSVINEDENVFAHTENIKAYLAAVQQLGVNQQDMFEVHDLLHNGDVQQVLRNIVALERTVVARGFTGPKMELEDKCEREDCANKIDSLQGEVGSLKRQLRDKEEDSRELIQENIDNQTKLAAKEEELVQLRAKNQALETSSGVLQEKYKLAVIDIQIIKQDYEQLQKQHEELKAAVVSNSINNVYLSKLEPVSPGSRRASISVAGRTPAPTEGSRSPNQNSRLTESHDGVLKKGSLIQIFKRTPSSPDLKKLEEMKKFIKKEKQEIIRQEKEKKKHEEKEREKLEKIKEEEEKPKLSKTLRSLTEKKFGKNKEKRQTISKDKLQEADITGLPSAPAGMRSSRSVEGFKEIATQDKDLTSAVGRERSQTAAGRLVSIFKPHNPEGNHTSAAVSIA